MKPARGLGRGLSALFSDTEEDYLQSGQTEETPAGGATEIAYLLGRDESLRRIDKGIEMLKNA